MSERPTLTDYDGYPDPPSGRTRPVRRPLAWNGGTDLGLLVLRAGLGAVLVAHGAQKVFGIWGGPGIDGFARLLAGLGYQRSGELSWATGVTELVAGALLVLGLLAPLAAAAVLAIMINAVLLKLGNGFFVTSPAGADAVEFDLLLGASAACLVLTGPGRIALDRGRAWHHRPGSWGGLALVLGVAVGVLVFVLLRRPGP
ncbi:MAG TPA: DoxX family protein [Pseudonocardia sp.]|jgi:putative oxidoreductase